MTCEIPWLSFNCSIAYPLVGTASTHLDVGTTTNATVALMMEESNNQTRDRDSKPEKHESRIRLIHLAAAGGLAQSDERRLLALVFEHPAIDQRIVEHAFRVAAADALEFDGCRDAAGQCRKRDQRVDQPHCRPGQEGDAQAGHADDAVEHEECADEGVVSGGRWDWADELTFGELHGERQHDDAEAHLDGA